MLVLLITVPSLLFSTVKVFSSPTVCPKSIWPETEAINSPVDSAGNSRTIISVLISSSITPETVPSPVLINTSPKESTI